MRGRTDKILGLGVVLKTVSCFKSLLRFKAMCIRRDPTSHRVSVGLLEYKNGACEKKSVDFLRCLSTVHHVWAVHLNAMSCLAIGAFLQSVNVSNLIQYLHCPVPSSQINSFHIYAIASACCQRYQRYRTRFEHYNLSLRSVSPRGWFYSALTFGVTTDFIWRTEWLLCTHSVLLLFVVLTHFPSSRIEQQKKGTLLDFLTCLLQYISSFAFVLYLPGFNENQAEREGITTAQRSGKLNNLGELFPSRPYLP